MILHNLPFIPLCLLTPINTGKIAKEFKKRYAKTYFFLIFLLAFISLCSPLFAQNYPGSQYLSSQELPQLPSLMPRNTVLALGIQEGAALAQEFPELITQWQELELALGTGITSPS